MDGSVLVAGLFIALLLGVAFGADAEKRWGSPYGLLWGLFVFAFAILGIPCYIVAVLVRSGTPARVCPKCGLTAGKESRFCQGCGQSFLG